MKTWGTWTTAAALAAAATASASAEVTESSDYGFVIAHSFETTATPEAAFNAIADVAVWWSGEHSYSGDAANFSLTLTPGGCLCEVWDGGFVKHAEVVQVRSGAVIRLEGGLGPMQDLAATQIQDFTVEASGAGAKVSYMTRVSGRPEDGLVELAPAVDGVMALQLGRLERYLATGSPDEAAE